jgi:quercetin dioxygenase-like cupin family protein
MKKLLAVTSGAALALSGLAGLTASAAPGDAPVPSLLVEGTLEGPARAQQDGIRLRTRKATTVRMFTLTYPVGSKSGWHRHPGIVLATVEQGTVTQQVGCKTFTWTKGQSFTEVEPHQVANAVTSGDEAAGAAKLRITQIFPADAPLPPREDVKPPRCRPYR